MSNTDIHNAEESVSLILPAILDLNYASQLKNDLQQALLPGGPVLIDASRVQRLSSICLQVLLSARHSLPDRSQVRIVACSDNFKETATGLALAEPLGLAGGDNG